MSGNPCMGIGPRSLAVFSWFKSSVCAAAQPAQNGSNDGINDLSWIEAACAAEQSAHDGFKDGINDLSRIGDARVVGRIAKNG